MRPDRQYIPGLTGLRALAAFWVMLFHISILLPPNPGSLFIKIAQYGYLGVDIFFILSGFVLAHGYHALSSIQDYRYFLIKRLARIYPVHITILTMLLAMIITARLLNISIHHTNDYTLSGFIAHFFLVSAWDFPVHPTWNHYAWAVSALWLCYILFPVLITFYQKINKPVLIICSVFWLCFTPIIASIWTYDSTMAYALPRALSGFNIGIILFFLHLSHSWLTRCGLWMDNRFLVYWGNRSYSLYMVQFPLVMTFKKFGFDRISDTNISIQSLLVTSLALAILAATICVYRWIERPGQKLLYRFSLQT